MLTESHTAVFRCELCEKLCETLWETLPITTNTSPIKRTGCKTVIGNRSEGEESKLAVKLCYYDIINFRFFGRRLPQNDIPSKLSLYISMKNFNDILASFKAQTRAAAQSILTFCARHFSWK